MAKVRIIVVAKTLEWCIDRRQSLALITSCQPAIDEICRLDPELTESSPVLVSRVDHNWQLTVGADETRHTLSQLAFASFMRHLESCIMIVGQPEIEGVKRALDVTGYQVRLYEQHPDGSVSLRS